MIGPIVSERRSFPRVEAPVFCRPVRPDARRRRVADISLGGVRVYADLPLHEGELLELEFFLPDGSVRVCTAEVVWSGELGPSDGARYEIGLRFVELSRETFDAFQPLLRYEQDELESPDE